MFTVIKQLNETEEFSFAKHTHIYIINDIKNIIYNVCVCVIEVRDKMRTGCHVAKIFCHISEFFSPNNNNASNWI